LTQGGGFHNPTAKGNGGKQGGTTPPAVNHAVVVLVGVGKTRGETCGRGRGDHRITSRQAWVLGSQGDQGLGSIMGNLVYQSR